MRFIPLGSVVAHRPYASRVATLGVWSTDVSTFTPPGYLLPG